MDILGELLCEDVEARGLDDDEGIGSRYFVIILPLRNALRSSTRCTAEMLWH